MFGKGEVEDFLQYRKIDAQIFSITELKSFSRYSFKLGLTGRISSFESIIREFGLFAKSVSEPVLYTDFSSGLLNIDVITGDLKTLDYNDAIKSCRSELSSLRIPMILGQDYTGHTHALDIADFPHMLVGGTTGSGKSMFLHSTINTIVENTDPNKINVMLIDPKMVEFGIYAKSKHLYGEVISKSADITLVLNDLLLQMNERFETLAKDKVRSIAEYKGKKKMPSILLIIDEVQSVIGKGNKENESIIAELAQKGRAAGIHIILATQHPSKEILNAKIKSNFPARVGFKTANAIYSRVLLDQSGAENLLGRGDGIFKLDNTFIRFKAPLIELENLKFPKSSFWGIFG